MKLKLLTVAYNYLSSREYNQLTKHVSTNYMAIFVRQGNVQMMATNAWKSSY